MNKYILVLASCTLLACSNYGQLTFLAKLPKKLNENSGMVILDSTSVWLIEDGSNKDAVYQVGMDGSLLRTIGIQHATNDDWEDLAADPRGNVYIPDTGNNSLDRKELIIYKIRDPRMEKGEEIRASEIRVRYPPEKKGKEAARYDSEALFYREGWLYMITKDRGTPFTGIARIFRVPSEAGSYEAEAIGSFTPCTQRAGCTVTAADLSPDGTRVVLLGYGRLWVFSDFKGKDFTRGRLNTYDLGATTQLESVSFQDNNTLLLSDERLGPVGGNLYRYSLGR